MSPFPYPVIEKYNLLVVIKYPNFKLQSGLELLILYMLLKIYISYTQYKSIYHIRPRLLWHGKFEACIP